MERLTNDPVELMNAAMLEVDSFRLRPGAKIIAYFSESHLYAASPFKIVLVQDQDGNICSSLREWDNAYNLKMWKNGIYNLDRLRIITDEKQLPESDQNNLMRLLNTLKNHALPKTIQSDSGIVIHGYEWQFGISFNDMEIDYRWSAATDDITLFVGLIDFMKDQYNKK